MVAALFTLCVITSILALVTAYFRRSFQYWERKQVPNLIPSIPFGNLQNSFSAREHIGIQVKKFYKIAKTKGWKYLGVYFFPSPKLLITDLDYLRNILTKDFQYFVDRGNYYNEKEDVISAHLFNLGGDKWRNLRVKLTPTFTSGKIKMMFQTLLDCEANLQEKMKSCCENDRPVDIKEVLACFTTDAIGSCAFGLECNSFKEDDAPFRVHGRKVLNPGRFRSWKRLFCDTFPKIGEALNLRVFPKDVEDFYSDIVTRTIDYRQKNGISWKDFIQLLTEMKNNNKITMEEIVAQSFVFFIAGFETSSTTMTFVLYELVRDQDIQGKVRKEIESVLAKYRGQITYEAIQDMKYMQQVIDETFRLHPPVPHITRKCVKDYKLPNEDLTIEKGTSILVSIMGIHYDEDYYPNPDKFDPDRFSEDNKKNRHPYSHLPFGEGPRLCIGMRFGLLQSKVGLASLLRKYKFTVNKKTREPLSYQTSTLVLSAEGNIWLNAEEI